MGGCLLRRGPTIALCGTVIDFICLHKPILQEQDRGALETGGAAPQNQTDCNRRERKPGMKAGNAEQTRKVGRLWAAALVVCAGVWPMLWAQGPPERAKNPADAKPTVVVSPDERVTFNFYAPDAHAMTVGGDFTMGKPAAVLTKGADGFWTYTTPPLPPDSYTYNFSVDGVSVLDQRSENFRDTPNALFNFFDMPGPATDFMALKDVPHGRVEAVIYHSKTLNMERRMHVYLPPGFEHMQGKLPVLYLLHGYGDNDISFVSAGKVPLILDNLYAAGKVVPMIVVMPSGHIEGEPRRAFTIGPEDDFSKDFLNDLVPYVERTYPVSTRREDTAIAGFSMGGGQLLNLALWHPEMFDYVYPISTGYFPAGVQEIEQKDESVLRNVASHPFKQFVFGKGEQDMLMAANTAATLAMMDKYGIPHAYRQLPGAHSFVFSRRFLAGAFPEMFH
jgi:enterochelin esterase-like enzyme